MRARRWLTALAASLGGVAWYLRGWQPLPDTACARLTEPVPGEAGLLEALSAADLKRDTAALSAIQPRNAGSPGEGQARAWVAARFREVGLRRVWLEPVLYPRWVGQGARLTALDAPAVELPCLALSGSAATPPGGLKAALIDVEGGQVADYARVEPRAETAGRIHLAWGGALHRRDICLNARRAGAVGVVIAHPDPRPAGPDRAGESHLVEAGTSVVLGRLPTLAVSHPVGQRLRELATRGVPVRLNVACRYTLGRGYNVVGELPGQRQEHVALIAHHDAWYSGAADNAAGVAGILALARAWLGRRGARPKRTLRFVSTAAEEEGLMGALADVVLRGLLVKARCRGVVSLDVVGAPGEKLWITGWPPQLRGAAVAIGRGLGYEAATGNPLGVYEGRAYGDHWPYTLLRVPGVMLSKFPYRYYHTPYDTPDRLDYEDARYQAAIAGILAWRLAVA